jgi:hypothetical protein
MEVSCIQTTIIVAFIGAAEVVEAREGIMMNIKSATTDGSLVEAVRSSSFGASDRCPPTVSRKSIRGFRLFIVTIVMAATLLGVVQDSRAQEAELPKVPKLAVVSGESIAFQVRSDALIDLSDAERKDARASILMTNTGSNASAVVVRGFSSTGKEISITPDKSVSLLTGETKRVGLVISGPVSDVTSGYVVFDAINDADDPVARPFTINRTLDVWILIKPVWGTLVLAVLLFFILCFDLRKAFKKSHRKFTLGTKLKTGKEWKFNESWASNIVAVGAIVVTFVAASGQLSQLLPQFPISQLVALSIGLGFIVLLAPVAYQACMVGEEGTCGGLLLAGLLTYWAVLGQTATLVLLINRSGADIPLRLILTGSLALSGALITIYVYRSVTNIVLHSLAPSERAKRRSTAIL